jgi:hypothetical protein
MGSETGTIPCQYAIEIDLQFSAFSRKLLNSLNVFSTNQQTAKRYLAELSLYQSALSLNQFSCEVRGI